MSKSNLVHNEQMKMMANAFNNLGVISLATGFLIPSVSHFLVAPNDPQFEINLGGLLAGVAAFIVCGSAAQIVLKDLKEDPPSYPPIEKVYPQAIPTSMKS